MLKKLNPSLSFLILAIFLWLIQYAVDVVVGDGDRKVIFLDIYVFVGFMQLFLLLLSVLFLPEVGRI